MADSNVFGSGRNSRSEPEKFWWLICTRCRAQVQLIGTQCPRCTPTSQGEMHARWGSSGAHRNEVTALAKKEREIARIGSPKGFPGSCIQSPRRCLRSENSAQVRSMWLLVMAGHERSVDAAKPRYVAAGSTSGLLRRVGMRCRLTDCRLHGLRTYGLVLVFLCRGDSLWVRHTPPKPVTARDADLYTSRMENSHRAIPLIQGKLETSRMV